jgi:putative thioredoxin
MPIEVTEQNFQQEVIDRSRELPVVVDFWAEWCGPCRTLGPIIEKAAEKRAGKLVLAKLDTEANPELAEAFRIQSIPAVKAFKDGQIVAEFVGAKPPAAVEKFMDGLVPSEAELLVEKGDEDSLRRAVELEPANAEAAVALARILHSRGESDEALRLVANFEGNFAAEALAARIRLEGQDEPDLRDVFAAIDQGEHERALERLLEAIPTADGLRDDIRRIAVGVFDELGANHPVAREYRRRLAAALY